MVAPQCSQQWVERSFDQDDRTAPATARSLLLDLEPLGRDPRRDLTIIVSELVANAIRHAPRVPAGTVRLVISTSGDETRIEVHDPGEGFDPTPGDPGEGGLGLLIVGQMAGDWGITGTPPCGASCGPPMRRRSQPRAGDSEMGRETPAATLRPRGFHRVRECSATTT